MPSPSVATHYPIDETLTPALSLYSQRPGGVVIVFDPTDPDDALTLNRTEQAALLQILDGGVSTDQWLDPMQSVRDRIYAIHDREGLHLCCGPLRFHLGGAARDLLHDVLHEHLQA